MTTQRIDRATASIIGITQHLGTKLTGARIELLRRLLTIDGYPTQTTNPKITATTELTTVENAANQRIHLQNDLHALDDELNAAIQILANLTRQCDRIIGQRLTTPGRCTATGRQGNLEWADPNCWNAPDRGPLCARCYHRERRWRQRNGLPIRETA